MYCTDFCCLTWYVADGNHIKFMMQFEPNSAPAIEVLNYIEDCKTLIRENSLSAAGLRKGEFTMLKTGMKAPDFTLKDKDGNDVTLSSFVGKKVVLYFYPKDSTPGCTRQACAFAAAYEGFKSKNVEVIGISKDSVSSHVKFAEKYSLPFILLSDPELIAIKAYGVWKEKKLYGKASMGVVRTTFIIDKNGFIEEVMEKVKPDTNASEILERLK